MAKVRHAKAISTDGEIEQARDAIRAGDLHITLSELVARLT
jgi:hypothetical protein